MFEQASGKPLEWFFTQWLNRPGVPKIEGSWRYDAAKKQVEVILTQTQAAEPYRLTVDVGVVAAPGALPVITRVAMTSRRATAMVDVAAEPASVSIDPSTWLLFDAGVFERNRVTR